MASPLTSRYCKYFFSARGCNQGSECKYIHQQTDDVRMDLPCTALSIDIETTGCWPGVHKIVAIGVALFQLQPSHQIVELDRRLFQFKVNYPQDFDELTMRDFWHVNGRMDLLDTLQDGAKCEEEAIGEFYDYYTEVCYDFPKFFMVTDNPVMDLGFLNLSIATKLGKPPLIYRPTLPSTFLSSGPSPSSSSSLIFERSPVAPTLSPTTSGSLPESESDEEVSTEDGTEGIESDEDGFGESGEEDCVDDASGSNISINAGAPFPLTSIDKADTIATNTNTTSKLQERRLASFYDNYSSPHFAVDLNSFACGLIGLHLPPNRKAGGSRWASPTDFLSFHKPFLICPFRKTHDPVDDASFNCWQFLQCVLILWMNEYADLRQARKDVELPSSSTMKLWSPSSSPSFTADTNEFPTIASANFATEKKSQRQRSPRRGRAVSAITINSTNTNTNTNTKKERASSPSVKHSRQQQQPQPQQHQNRKASTSASSPRSGHATQQHVQRRTSRSLSDPAPLVPDTASSSSCLAAIAQQSSRQQQLQQKHHHHHHQPERTMPSVRVLF